MTVPVILVSSQVKPEEDYYREVKNDISPRVDYFEIAKLMGAEIRGYKNSYWSRPVRSLENRMKIDIFEAFSTARRSSDFDLFLSASEKSAIPISMLLAALNKEVPHLLIGHHLSSIAKTKLYRYWNFPEHIQHVICVSKPQAEFALSKLKFEHSRVSFVFDKVDQNFFKPRSTSEEDFILSVGQEQRDYQTLISAVAGTGIRVVVVASSPWSRFPVDITEKTNIRLIKNLSYSELRNLYDKARIVVIPLFENNYGAGLNASLEAMAMAKPLIITKTEGVSDYLAHGETGFYVSSGNVAELKDGLCTLWENPGTRKRIGSNARQAVQQYMNIDLYVENLVGIIREYR